MNKLKLYWADTCLVEAYKDMTPAMIIAHAFHNERHTEVYLASEVDELLSSLEKKNK
jgi:hypothetical protein